uniref:Uncharacterized protein n=1 Tax=Mycena chlorophos TaxID=658473 RepID=A0ABQ0L7Y0_MYCCL|nr:predicted protein [Mycena chlorophos]
MPPTHVNLPSDTQPPAAEHPGSRPGTLSARDKRAHPPTSNSAPRRARRNLSRLSPYRAIIRWLGDPPLIANRPSEEDLVSTIESSTGKSSNSSQRRIQGVSWTPAGNLAVFTRHPYLASQLIEENPKAGNDLESRLRDLFEDRRIEVVVDADAPWTWAVLHGIPAAPFWDAHNNGGDAVWVEFFSQGYGDADILSYTPMVKAGHDRDATGHLSLKLAFTNPAAAQRLLRQRGLFLFGAHCKAAKYRQ